MDEHSLPCIEHLANYQVSKKYGFLVQEPIMELPEYFIPWVDLARKAASLAKKGELRKNVNKLPLLDHAKLVGYREQTFAHCCLSVIGSCYVWQDGDAGAPKTIPANVALPWMGVSRLLGLNPIVCHQDTVICNWMKIDTTKSLEFGNIRTILAMTPGGVADEIFWTTTILVEANFAAAIEPLLSAIHCARSNLLDGLADALRKLTEVVHDMQQSLTRMHEMDPCSFYNEVRPYLNGWDGNNHVLPGIVYEGVCNEPIQCSGGSAAQSPALQCLDALLGIQHQEDKREFLKEMRSYMFSGHKKFIEDILRLSQVRRCVLLEKSHDLQTAYNSCIKAIKDFRSYHIQIVTKYVTIQSNKTGKDQSYGAVAKQGTGGSSIMPFLKNIRMTTESHVLP